MGVLHAVMVYLVVGQVTAYNQLVQKGLTLATSSTTYKNFDASRAVDKNISQDINHCSHTHDLCEIKEAWLRIDLTKVYSIASVKFWYRKDESHNSKRLPGYSILFSNESWPNSSCYRNQNSSGIGTVNTNECRATTRYLWFYQQNKPNKDCAPMLEICEVEVFGCDVGFYDENCSKKCGLCKSGSCDIETGCVHGFYGENCSRTCSEFCKNNNCNQTSGTCLEGCLKGYIGKHCNKTCPSGHFGEKCSETCGHCSQNLTCNHINGTCNGGCVKGLKGQFCKTECAEGEFGENCQNNCSGHCINRYKCDKVSGYCSPCSPGFEGSRCNLKCTNKTYGENCSNTCGRCRNSVPCNNINGECPNGCDPGWQPTDKCDVECINGTYGENCTYRCGECLNGVICNHVNGTCPKGCTHGWQNTDKCDKQCNNGTYGENCTYQCGECLDAVSCNHADGTCPKGCNPGWQNTDMCDKPCRNGTFGINCIYNCSGNCEKNDTCDRRNGACVNCAPGWENQHCNKTCDVGSYGSNCEETCGRCLGAGNCSLTDGICSGGCQEGFTGDNCHEPLDTNEGLNPILIFAPSAGFVVVLSILAVVLCIILRRRRNKRRKRKDDVSHQEIINLDADPDTAIRSNTTRNKYRKTGNGNYAGIHVSKLIVAIHCLERDSNKGFLNEFQSIPYGEQPEKPCTVGKLPENIPKNRFKTTFPYDHSRIILRYEEKTKDYINANFIKNAYRQPAYIAAQGPLVSTIEDFWQMVWQEDVYVIAMVTNLSEGGTIKCAKYWPDNTGDKIKIDIFGIQLDSEKTYSSFLIHQLQLTNLKTKASRQITHLQYTAWLDHGTPDPLELFVYHQYVTKAMKKHLENKLLVHCRAGIGRTGTFIALDALYRHGIKDGSINIVEYVNTMREDRMNMIQNPDQYKFLYHALYESFRAKTHPFSKENFLDGVKSVLSSHKADKLSNLRIQFKELDSLKPVFQENEKSCGFENMTLNMTGSVLPADKIRIILTSHVKGRGTYYNAVPVSTFTMRDCIITAQYPVPGAAVNLIRLLVDQECSSMISTSPLSEVPSSREWFYPSPKGTMIFQYQVKVDEGVRETDYVIKSTIRIKAPAANDWQDVTLYEMTTWNTNDKLPREYRPILDVVSLLHFNKNVDAENKIAVLSRDGASRCGEFCAVYNAIQQLQQDQEVDMFTIVRQLQSRRPEMISSMNEYTFCCQAVAQFIKTDSGVEDVYMNYQPENDESIYANV